MPLALLIDPEFQRLLRQHTPDEKEALENSIVTEKRCRDAIVVWKGTRFIVDGHTRYEICLRRKIPFEVIQMNFPNRAAVLEWMIQNQRGRRNWGKEERDAAILSLRKEGQSTRKIAETVGTSPATVVRVVSAGQANGSGVSFETPAAVTGKDGKTYAPTRPILASPVAGEACEPPKDGRLPKKLPNGKVKFDHKLIDKALRGVAGLIERMGAAYGKHQHYRKCDMLGNEFAGAVQTWHREAT